MTFEETPEKGFLDASTAESLKSDEENGQTAYNSEQQKIKLKIDLFQDGVPDKVSYIAQKLVNAGFEAYLVGGAVRDILLSGSLDAAFDYDFATNARPEEVIDIFKNKKQLNMKSRQKIESGNNANDKSLPEVTAKAYSGVFSIPTGLQHGTVTVVIGEEHFEITTYRVDGEYTDARHPDSVCFSRSVIADLSRRDFTINAMAYELFGQYLLDPFGGLSDLKSGVIRTVGDPLKRFREDALRLVRACRFAARLNFEIEEKTLDAMKTMSEGITKISMERIHDELFKIMKTTKPSIALEYMRKTGILNYIIPELLEGFQVDQNEFHKYDIYYHNLYSCDAAPVDRPLIRFSALFHDIGKAKAKKYAIKNGNGNVFYNHEIISEKMAFRIMKRLKFSNHDALYIKKLIKMHMFYYTDEWTDGAVRRFLGKLDGNMDSLQDLFLLRRADREGSGLRSGDAAILKRFKRRIDEIIQQDNALKVTDLDISGNDLMEYFGLMPGKIIGEILHYLLDRVLDEPELNKKDLLLEEARLFLEKAGENS